MTALFRDLRASRWGYLDMERRYRRWSARYSFSVARASEVSEPAWFQGLVDDAHNELGLDCSYGGWMESREDMLDHTYLRELDAFVHLGLDLNVPAGASVYAGVDGVVEVVDDDTPDAYGWGPRVVLNTVDMRRDKLLRVVYAHLDAESTRGLRVGNVVRADDKIGRVGAPPANGGWWPHLHLQLVSETAWTALRGRLNLLDSYGRLSQMHQLARDFPDPCSVLTLF